MVRDFRPTATGCSLNPDPLQVMVEKLSSAMSSDTCLVGAACVSDTVLLSENGRELAVQMEDRIRRRLAGRPETPARAQRSRNMVIEQLSLQSIPLYASMRATEIVISRTEMGQPILVQSNGFKIPNAHISFSHDGGQHVAVLVVGNGICGIGTDIVHLPRLNRPENGDEFLMRFGSKFMSEREFSAFLREADASPDIPLLHRAAAHFSLMESASKALGTGLKMGGGMGGDFSVPKQSIEIIGIDPVRFALTGMADDRRILLSGCKFAGHWQVDGEYLISMTILLSRD